ncbi:MAG: LL-diaminopimelate aminotransferase [Thermodesulfobacteriota bacterium]|nr:LL-diaminopimelate aminotransferase [Thermodesulfobacteriota bacterium]
MFKVEKASRIKELPPYLFATIDKLKEEQITKGIDIIDLSIGDPDIPTPSNIIDRMKYAIEDRKNHRYPSYEGMIEFRMAVSRWYKMRFNVELDPKEEVLSLIGSKEGIAHISLAFVNPGDIALVPDPAYPVYSIGAKFAGGKPYFFPLLKENRFLPDLNKIPEPIARKAKLIFLNYPNNPTASVATRDFFEELIEFALKYNIIVCHDAPYTEIYYDGDPPISFLEIKGAKDVGIEFHSLSKTYNMTGWRVGFAVGNAYVLKGLGGIKTNVDSGLFQAIQEAGIEALEGDQSSVDKMRRIYQQRRDALIDGLIEVGLKPEIPKAAFYIWVPVPDRHSSASFSAHLLNRAGIVTTPGNGFGDCGEGYIRMALTVSKEKIIEGISRMKDVGI